MFSELIERYPSLSVCAEDIKSAEALLIETFERGGKLLLAGNGGSSADCDHIVGELMKGFLKMRPLPEDKKREMKANFADIDESVLLKLQCGLPAVSLSSASALNTAFSNDVDADLVFAQGVLGLGRAGDALIAISTSGNSRNVCQAARVARALGMKVIALTGECGDALGEIANVTVRVPEKETFKVQELHLPVYHYLCAAVEEYFFG